MEAIQLLEGKFSATDGLRINIKMIESKLNSTKKIK
jgi:hypothetical protein